MSNNVGQLSKTPARGLGLHIVTLVLACAFGTVTPTTTSSVQRNKYSPAFGEDSGCTHEVASALTRFACTSGGQH